MKITKSIIFLLNIENERDKGYEKNLYIIVLNCLLASIPSHDVDNNSFKHAKWCVTF